MRETTAQALGTALLPLRLPALRGVVGLLGRLVTAPVWEARRVSAANRHLRAEDLYSLPKFTFSFCFGPRFSCLMRCSVKSCRRATAACWRSNTC